MGESTVASKESGVKQSKLGLPFLNDDSNIENIQTDDTRVIKSNFNLEHFKIETTRPIFKILIVFFVFIQFAGISLTIIYGREWSAMLLEVSLLIVSILTTFIIFFQERIS